MELSEAKKILKDMQWALTYDGKQAIDTVLKALDNSIPKEKVREKIEELELLKKALPIRTEIPRFIDYLQELLGEE